MAVVWIKRGPLAAAVLLLLGVVCILNVLISRPNGNAPRPTPDVHCGRWFALVSKAKDCILHAVEQPNMVVPDQFWFEMDDMLDRCAAEVRHEIDLQLINNTDDTKGFVDFVDKEKSCTVLTLGIGNDTTAEERVKELVPSCKFYGADPMPDQGAIYKKLGVYIPVAVSNETGTFTASVLVDYVLQTYVEETVLTLEFIEFMTKVVKLNVVDYMFYDAEGAEYPTLPYFMRGGQLDKAGITTCQLSLEFHGHPPMPLDVWRQKIIDFFQDSDYLPLWSGKAWPHLRTILINWRSPICIKKFYANLC